MPAKIKQDQFPRVLHKLEKSFHHYPDCIMEYGDETINNRAMARGVKKKNGVLVPRFVLTLKQDILEDPEFFLSVEALTGRGLPKGDYHGFDYPADLRFKAGRRSEDFEGPLDKHGELIDGGDGYLHSAAVACGTLLLPAALEAEPLKIEGNRISRILLAYI